MTLPIGPRPVGPPQLPLAVPGPDASAEVHEAFKQALSALGKHDRHDYLRTEFADAARRGDRQTISQLNPMLDGRDDGVLSEALDAAAAKGHGKIINAIFRGRGWLWARDKFSVMTCIVENYDPGNPRYRRAFRDLFSHVPDERRIVSRFGDAFDYEGKLTRLLCNIRMKDPELFDWCHGELARERTPQWQ